MQTADLVRMANQIARYFAGYPDAEAVDGVRGHLQRFWDPVMRRQLAEDVAAGRAELLPLAQRALSALTDTANTTATGGNNGAPR